MARVLIVDDHALNRELVATVLHHVAHDCREAANGSEALQLVRAWQPDLVICDILMPGMDGYEFVRQLRADTAIANTEVIFYTATFIEQEAKVLAAACGVTQVLTKPCEPQQILAVVDKVLARPQGSVRRVAAEPFDRNHLRLITDKLVEKANALEHQNHRLSALTELTLRLASESDPSRVIDTFCQGARELFAARCALAVVNEASQDASVHVSSSGIALDEVSRWPALRPGDGAGGTALRARSPCRMSHDELLASWPALAGTLGTCRSGLLAPITSLHQAFGWVLLLDGPQTAGFTDEDEHLLAIEAAHVGRIYENSSLVARVREQIGQLQAQAAERERESTILKLEHAVSRSLAAAPSVATGVRAVIQILCESQLWQLGRYWQVDPAAQRLKLFAQWQDDSVPAELQSDGLQVQPTLRMGEGLAGRVWQTGSPIWETALSQGAVAWGKPLPAPLHAASGSLFPVQSDGRTIGVLSLLSLQTRQPDERLRASGQMVCNQLGQFLHRKEAESALRQSEQFTQRTLDSLLEHIGVLDTSGVLLAVNQAWRIFTHGDGEPLLRARLGANYLAACEAPRNPPSPEATAFAAGVRGVLAGNREMFTMEYPCLSGGAEYWFRARVTRFAQNDPPRVVVSHEDMTERRFVEQRVRRLHRVATVLGDINALIVRVQQRDVLFQEACRISVATGRFNKACVVLLDAERQRGTMAAAVDTQGGSSTYFAHFESLLDHWLTKGHPAFDEIVTAQRPVVVNDIASATWMRAAGAALETGARSLACLPLVHAGQSVGALILFASERNYFDAQEMRLLAQLASDMSFALDFIGQAERLNHLAYYDALTGLANSRLFNERLVQEMASGVLHNYRVVLAYLNLDRFKTINDSLGRKAGDMLLKLVAERLGRFADNPARVARVGADHFTLMIPQVHSDLDLARTLNELHQHCMRDPFMLDGTELRVSGRIGVAICPADGVDAETLYRNAESAAARARAAAETVLFYDARMTESVSERLALENELRVALRRQEFVLHYQPKVIVDTRELAGVEALIRWQHPKRGLVPPLTFIPLMEETGLINEVGAWALTQAASDVGRWQALGLAAPRVAVNVSAIQLRRPEFVDIVKQALNLGTGPTAIDIEITESTVMENIEPIIAVLHSLRSLGVDLAIDDFGTGYSSLAYLAKLPVQILKIDRAFVMGMQANSAGMTLVATMVSMAHALRMKVVAEGVETESQAQALALLHCDQLQGYLVSRPLPFDQMTTFLQHPPAIRIAPQEEG